MNLWYLYACEATSSCLLICVLSSARLPFGHHPTRVQDYEWKMVHVGKISRYNIYSSSGSLAGTDVGGENVCMPRPSIYHARDHWARGLCLETSGGALPPRLKKWGGWSTLCPPPLNLHPCMCYVCVKVLQARLFESQACETSV